MAQRVKAAKASRLVLTKKTEVAMGEDSDWFDGETGSHDEIHVKDNVLGPIRPSERLPLYDGQII